MKLPEIGETIDNEMAIELCRHFGFEELVQRIEANPESYKPWVFDGASMLPDLIVSRLINVPDLTEIALKHDLKYAYGVSGDDEDRLKADYELGVDLLASGASARVAMIFFGAVQAGGGELGLSFSWGFAAA